MAAFNGDRALVFGGSGGIGRAVCERLAAAGLAVNLTYRNSLDKAQAAAEAIAEQGGFASIHQVDITVAEEVEQVVAEAVADGELATVVYASGPAIKQPYVGQVTLDEWRHAVDAEVHGFFHIVRAALPHLRKSAGSIVAVTSAGLHRYPPRDVLSVAPKGAVEALVKAVAREEGRNGIRANCVALGVIDAGMFLRLKGTEFDDQLMETMRQNAALKRFGSAEEVAEAVHFFSSNQSSFSTGQTLLVDGGYSI